jgi:hypothetical protein
MDVFIHVVACFLGPILYPMVERSVREGPVKGYAFEVVMKLKFQRLGQRTKS